MRFLKGDRWENVLFFMVNLGHVTPQINHLRKMSPVLRVSTQIYGVSQGDRWENIHL